MNLNLLFALYGSGIIGVIAYFWLLPQLSQQTSGSYLDANGRLNFYTTGTGELHKCYPYTFRVMVSEEKVKIPKPQINVICQPRVPAELMNFNQTRGVVLNGTPKKIPT